MGAAEAEVLQSLRASVLERLRDLSSSLGNQFPRVPDKVLREQFSAVIDRMYAFFADGNRAAYQNFLGRWVAMRMGEGIQPEIVANSLVTFGDIIGRVARRRLGEDEAGKLAVALVGASESATEVVIDVVSRELERRMREQSEQQARGPA